MNDERYTFVQDVREKKVTARSAYKRRTHCGKGGAVKFPSDYMTKKERETMNGECKSYRLNEPMKWADYLDMPDDIRVQYIQLLRNKFKVPFQHIGVMLGVSQKTISREILRLGLSEGKGGANRNWDKEGFYAWWKGVTTAPTEEDTETQESPGVRLDPLEDIKPCALAPLVMSVPEEGSLVFEGPADAALDSIKLLLQNANAKIKVSWTIVDAESGAV